MEKVIDNWKLFWTTVVHEHTASGCCVQEFNLSVGDVGVQVDVGTGCCKVDLKQENTYRLFSKGYNTFRDMYIVYIRY